MNDAQGAVTILLIFNHRHSDTISRVINWNRQFATDIRVATPSGKNNHIRYSSGSYLWQGALVEYLEGIPPSASGHTLVIHDDFVLNPNFSLDEYFRNDPNTIRFHGLSPRTGTAGWWPWDFRLLTAWFTPRTGFYGSGVDDPIRALQATLLYEQEAAHIQAMEASVLTVFPDDPAPPEFRAWQQQYFPNRTHFDFGLPIYNGNADYMFFQNKYAGVMADFLRATIECGLFVEFAIPTMLKWMNLPIQHEDHRQIHAWGSFDQLRSISQLRELFAAPDYCNIQAIHPVKFSLLTDGNDHG